MGGISTVRRSRMAFRAVRWAIPWIASTRRWRYPSASSTIRLKKLAFLESGDVHQVLESIDRFALLPDKERRVLGGHIHSYKAARVVDLHASHEVHGVKDRGDQVFDFVEQLLGGLSRLGVGWLAIDLGQGRRLGAGDVRGRLRNRGYRRRLLVWYGGQGFVSSTGLPERIL